MLDGTVSGEEEVTYDFATIPAKFTPVETLEVDVNRDGAIQEEEKYVYLSMSYILTDNDAERTTLEADGLQFTFSPENGEDIVFDEGLHAVPVQRNWRTNILGKILTGDIQFNIEIDQRFDDNYNLMYPDKDDNSTAVFNVTNANELQTALNNATDGAVIYFANDITGNVTAEQKEGVNIVVYGNGYKYDGTITLDGNARHTGTETLTLANINFEHTDGSIDFIVCNVGGGYDGYAHNVTVKDCTFKGNSNGDVVGMRYRQCYNMNVINCTATDVHSLMWTTGGENITVDGVNVTAKEGGLSTATTKNISVKNSTITVPTAYGYGIRLNSSDDNTDLNLNIENNTITAEAPILLRQAKNNTYTITLTGNNTLLTDKVYHIITTAGEYKDGVALSKPTGTVHITGADKFNVYPIAANTPMYAYSTTQLKSVVAEGYTNINLVDGTYDMTKLSAIAGKTLTFIGAGENTIFDYSSQTYNKYVSGDNGTFVFKNMTIQRSTATFAGMAHTASTSYENCIITGTYYVYETTAKFTDCKFNVTGDFYNCWLYGTSSATYEKCEFNCSGKSIYVDGNGETGSDLTTNTCVFNDNGGVENKAAIETGNTYGKRYSLTINNTTVNGFSTTEAKSPAVDGAELGTNVWGNKNYMTKDKLSVTIDGTKVY